MTHLVLDIVGIFFITMITRQIEEANKTICQSGATMAANTSSLGYERVYLPLYKVADTPFHIQEDNMTEAKS